MNRIANAVGAFFAFLRRTLAANMWRLLTVAAIIFAAGISGAWLSEQMHAPLPAWWGWFGAGLAGVAIFGGVTLVLEGGRIGWLVILVGAVAEIALSMAYFGEGHGFLLALALGVYPTGLAILGGVVEATQERRERTRELEREDREWARELEREAHRAELERLAEQQRLQAEVAIERARAKALADSGRTVAGQLSASPAMAGQWPVTDRPAATRADVAAWLSGQPDSVTGADVAAAFGVSERTGRRWLAECRPARV